jgi:phytoene/squalene synthetase
MEMDLQVQKYDRELYTEYIYGSAEVVGLMCLFIFCEGDKNMYHSLKSSARSLGAAFQKVNFLRDIKADLTGLDRVYFPGCDFKNFTCLEKEKIEREIQIDFDNAYEGIMRLPMKARFGVYVAYKYYFSLFMQIKSLKPSSIMDKRVRIPNYRKVLIIMRAGVKNQLNLI